MLDNEKWFIKSRKGNPAELAGTLGISGHLSKLLIARSICETGQAFAFLNPSMDGLHDAHLLKDMDRALQLIQKAAGAGEKVLVIGDYDVDGIMGILILCAALSKVFSSVGHYIPHRVDDGYGISEKIVENARDDGVKLIITCDNGISAHESIRLAKSFGMTVIVTDHHEVANENESGLPEADAVVDPKRADCPYPFKGLCGAAVAYKLAIALMERMEVKIADADREELFCFAALATICDIVELLDENRSIVYHGLKLLNRGVRNEGLNALIDVCGLSGKELTTHNIGHILGPCINATGRLDTAELSYKLFTAPDCASARALADNALELNRRRQTITAESVDAAERLIAEQHLCADRVMVLYIPGTHESVAGIVAGRLKDRYARPVIVFTDTEAQPGLLKGSGRSVERFNLFESLTRVRTLMVKYGGHSMAVGVTLEADLLQAFRAGVNQVCGLTDQDLEPKELIDLCLDAEEVSPGLIQEISLLEPFGRGNARPVLAIRQMTMEFAGLVGAKKNVVKMKLRSEKDHLLDAVFFGDIGVFARSLRLEADSAGILTGAGQKPCVDVIFYPELNLYNDMKKVQLVVRSVRIAEG